MKSNDDILKDASKRFRQCIDSTQYWRTNELIESYQMESGIAQWTKDDYDKQIADAMPVITINKSTPVIDAIAGFEIQNRTVATYQPRLTKDQQEGFSDLVGNTVAYIDQDSGADIEDSQAFRDMLICGIGFTNTSVDFNSKNPDGDVIIRRGFPGFLLYDPASRRKNMIDSDWFGEAQVSPTQQVADEYDLTPTEAGMSFFDDSTFINYYGVSGTKDDLTVVYEYQWRERESFWRFKNPFEQLHADEFAMNYMVEAMKSFGFQPADAVFNLSIKDGNEFKKQLDLIGIQYQKPIKQKRYRYYRAIIAGGAVQEASESYSQQEFSIQVMTGKYDELNQCYYGAMRAMKEPQRLLNQATSDYQGFLNTIPKGGVIIQEDGVSDIKGFIDTYAKAKEVTVVKDINKVTPKQGGTIPQGLPEMIAYAARSLMEVVGVTPDFMGLVDTKDMTGGLFAQKVRQALTVLAPFFDAKRAFTLACGRLKIDCVRVLAETSEGRIIRNVTGDESQPYFALLSDGIAAEYDVVIEETPQTSNERAETFQQLMNLAGPLLQKPTPVDITPMAIEFAPLPKAKIEEIKKAMQPPPPPPVDPRPGLLLESEAALNQATAQEKQAHAKQMEIETLAKFQEIQNGGAPNEPDPIKLLDAQLKAEEQRIEHRRLDLGHEELKVKALDIVQKHKAVHTKAGVDLVKIAKSDTPGTDGMDAMEQDDAALQAEQERKDAEAQLREEAQAHRDTELQKREDSVNQQMQQMAGILQSLKEGENQHIAQAIAEMGKAVSEMGKNQKQLTTAITLLAKAEMKPDAPQAVNIEIIRNAKGDITGATRRMQ